MHNLKVTQNGVVFEADPRIIFLDVDGVLNHIPREGCYLDARRFLSRSTQCLERSCMEAFAKMWHEAGGPSIVFSSTWRILPDHVSSLTAALYSYGVKGYVGCTGSGKSRGDEIRDWLDRHPEVEKFVTVEDEPFDVVTTPGLEAHVVKTSLYDYGFGPQHIEPCLALLNEAKVNQEKNHA